MKMLSMVFALLLLVATPAMATDVWDYANDNDNGTGTDNVLWHTAPAQVHDLGYQTGPVADQDWFIVYPKANRSYEVQVLNITGDTDVWAADANFRRYAADGTTVLQSGRLLDASSGWIKTLRWMASTSAEITN